MELFELIIVMFLGVSIFINIALFIYFNNYRKDLASVVNAICGK